MNGQIWIDRSQVYSKTYGWSKNVGGELVRCDPNDSVGVIDRYHPKAYFSEYEDLIEVDRLKEWEKMITFPSPNYLHDAYRFTKDRVIEYVAISFKSLQYSSLEELQVETGKNIYPILQLRLHQSIIDLKQKVGKKKNNKVELKYVTPRGKWYHYSWKGDEVKSGGIATNIGIHFFDMLLWIFGDVKNNYVEYHTKQNTSGYLELERANVEWSLSVDKRDLPHKDWKKFRTIKVNGEEVNFLMDLQTYTQRPIGY